MKRNLNSLIYSYAFVLLFIFSCFGQNNVPPVADAKTEELTLEFGQTVEREIAGGARHDYKIKLAQGQFIKIEAEQNNCDIMLALKSPEKINIFEYKDDNYQNGKEIQTAAVESAGEYELEVMSFEEADQKGKYTLKVAELRPATEKELNQTGGFIIVNGLAKNIKTGTATADQLRQSIADFQVALNKFRFAGNRKYEALVLSSIGSFYTRLGNWNKAVELQQQSLEINRNIGAEDDASLLLSNIGTTYLRNNEPQKALEMLYESVSISVKREDILNHSRALNLIGNVYENLGDINRALTYYSQALEKAQEISQENFVADAFNNLGKANYALGENQKAAEFFQKAVVTARKINNKRQEAVSLGNLGQTFFALSNQTKALELLTESLNVNRSLSDKIGEAATLKKFGKIYLTIGATEKAIEYFNQSLEIYRALEDTQNLAETLLLSAKAENKKGNVDAAQVKTEEAISLIEKIRARVQTAELRDSFSANLQDYYAFYIELLMARHKRAPDKNFAALALQANERARARGLLNLLAESNADIRQGADVKLLEKESDLKNLLSARLENLTKVLNGKTEAEQTLKLKNEIEQIRAEYEQTQAQIRAASPRYAALTQPKTLSLKEIQSEVLDTDSVLLEYALGETKSFLWIVTKNNFQTIELPSREKIEATAKQVYDALTARNKQVKFETADERRERIEFADADFISHSKDLSRMIFASAASVSGNQRLLVVADGALQYIPFSVLLNGEKYLIESNEIVNLPSASALAGLRKEMNGRLNPAKTLAIFADPIFEKNDERFASITNKNKAKPQFQTVAARNLTREGLELSRLPFTRREAELVGSLVPSNQQTKRLDFEANRQFVLSSELSNYRYIHFATHGFINSQTPELSSIVLSLFDENGAEQDGFLRVGDIYNLKLNAEMVVLSGCRTGLGREIKGEGLVGLTRGFMYAGARRVAVSLWDVNDEATADLMGRFYREMLGTKKLSPSASLRQAQISMIRDKNWSSPYYWSAFILQGEPK
jgi:CHAT domain-containing protein